MGLSQSRARVHGPNFPQRCAMYFSLPELSRHRENLVTSSLQASAACIAAAERLTQLSLMSGAEAVATQQQWLQRGAMPDPDTMVAAHQAHWMHWFQQACGIACEAQVQWLNAVETRLHGMDRMASAAIRREMDTLPVTSEPFLAGAKAAVDCLDQTVEAVTEGALQTLAGLEAAVAGLEPAQTQEPETEGGALD